MWLLQIINEMLFLVVPAGLKVANIAKKLHNSLMWVMLFFPAMIANLVAGMNPQKIAINLLVLLLIAYLNF